MRAFFTFSHSLLIDVCCDCDLKENTIEKERDRWEEGQISETLGKRRERKLKAVFSFGFLV